MTTRCIVPRAHGEGSIGDGEKHWGKAYIQNVSNVYNTVVDMKADVNLREGDKCQTLGYYTVDDGGAARYSIRAKLATDITADGIKTSEKGLILLDNELVAELAKSPVANVRQWGLIDNDDNITIQTILKHNYVIYFPGGTYTIKNGTTITGQIEMFGDKRHTIIEYIGTSNMFSKTSNDLIWKVRLHDFQVNNKVENRDSVSFVNGRALPFFEAECITAYNFNYVFNVGDNSWCCSFENCIFENNNIAISGDNEFNALNVRNTKIVSSFVKGIAIGRGYGQWVTNCTIEHCPVAIDVYDMGDKHIKDCYFENDDVAVDIRWVFKPCDIVEVTGCVDYIGTKNVIFVKNTASSARITISKCLMRENNGYSIKLYERVRANDSIAYVSDNIGGAIDFATTKTHDNVKNCPTASVLDIEEDGVYYTMGHSDLPVGANATGLLTVSIAPHSKAYRFLTYRPYSNWYMYVNVCSNGNWIGWKQVSIS